MEKSLDELAEIAYAAFCDATRSYLPPQTPLWPELPEALKKAWKQVAATVIDADHA